MFRPARMRSALFPVAAMLALQLLVSMALVTVPAPAGVRPGKRE